MFNSLVVRPLAIILRAFLLSAVCIGSVFADEPAQAEPTRFDIEQQSLKSALTEFARQSDREILYSTDVVADREAPPVEGIYEPEEALDLLLADTGLDYSVTASETFLVNDAGGDRDSGNVNPTPVLMAQNQSNQTSQMSDGGDDVPSEIEEILVTGTSIKGVAPAGSPILVFDAQTIEESGYSGTEQFIQSIPQIFRGGEAGASADVALSTGTLRGVNATAGSGVNLRGLGATATLVLINGRRIAASSSGTFTDISAIPINAIERMEILLDGASAIYGADAVAGVVNIILKQGYEGAETELSYGATTEDGREEFRINQIFGKSWTSGNATLIVDYVDQSELSVDERDATASVLTPTAIFPENKALSGVFSGWQQITDKLSLRADAQYSSAERFLLRASRPNRFIERPVDADRYNANIGLTLAPTVDWEYSVWGTISQEDIDFRVRTVQDLAILRETDFLQKQDASSVELRGSGKPLKLGGGALGVAFGASYTEQDYELVDVSFNNTTVADREIKSAYLEFHLPLVSSDNAKRGISRLELSLAGRYDDYSDFGDTTNPKVGLLWSPTQDLDLRASWSTSFRAPSVGGELANSFNGVTFVDIEAREAADGSGPVPVISLFGSNALNPEESENFTAGFTYAPAAIDDLSIDLSYYSIEYTDRIMVPPFPANALSDPALASFVTNFATNAELQSVVSEFLAQGAILSDFTGGIFGPDPLNQALIIFDTRTANFAELDVSGYDLNIAYAFNWGAFDMSTSLNINYIEELRSKATPTADPFDIANTFSNPTNWRARGGLSWSRRDFSGALNVNYVDSYTNNRTAIEGSIASFTTTDLSMRYDFGTRAQLDGSGSWSIFLNVINLFDKEPPFVASDNPVSSNYDVANASPLGRFVTLGIRKRW